MPSRESIICRVVGYVPQVGTIGMYHIYFHVAIAVGVKSDLTTIWRPSREHVSCFVICKPCQHGTVGIHHIDLQVAITTGVKSNLCAVW